MVRQVINKGVQSGFKITGIKEIKDILENIVPKVAENLLRTTNFAIASEVKTQAAKNARNNGLPTVAKALKAQRKNSPPDKPISVVVVEHGAGAKFDAWYWHFHEFGTAPRFTAGQPTGRITEKGFIRKAKNNVSAKLDVIIKEKFQKQLVKKIKAVQKKKRAQQ